MANTECWLARPTHYWQQPSELIDGTFSFARRYEGAGFDGLLFFDTQNLAPEALVSLTAAAKETTSLRLGTGVTNPHDAARRGRSVSLLHAAGRQQRSGLSRDRPRRLSACPPRLRAHAGRGRSRSTCRISCPTCVAKRSTSHLDADVDGLHLADTPEASRIRVVAGLPQGAGGRGRHRFLGLSRSQRGSRTGST